MAFELFANSAASTLSAAITSTSAATLTVTSATPFPAGPNFRILIDSEILLVTGVSGTTFTVSRGAEGTTAATHLNGAAVTHILTAASVVLAGTLSGTFASQPAAGVAGRKYYCTDCPFWYLDTGAAWQKYFGSYPIITPSNTGYSWDNQGGATLTTTQDMITLSAGNQTGLACRFKTAPSTPYTYAVGFLINGNTRETFLAGIGFRDGSSGKLVAFYMQSNSGLPALSDAKFTTSTSFSGTYTALTPGPMSLTPLFLAAEDDGTNFTFSISSDGVNWAQFDQQPRTDFLTTPGQVFFCFSGNTSSVSLIHASL